MGLTAGAQAQTTTSGVRVGDTDVKGAARTDHLAADTYSTTRLGSVMPIGKANKASSLIGMDVRNSQNEKLGDIKDLVVDLHSGKVAYVVLSVGGFLGIGDKLVAIPPNAFMSAEQEKLVLNADKAKLQNAPSFAKTSWPELNSPTWNSDLAYWTSDATAQGTVGSSRTGTFSSRSDATLNQTDVDRDHVSSTRVLPDRPGTSVTSRDQFRGRIATVNPETGMMTIEGPAGSREFKFSERPVITLRDNRSPRIVDLKVGYPVVVGYHELNGTYIADTVIRTDAPDVK